MDIIEMPLTEQAFERKKLFAIMDGIQYPLAMHVLKLIALDAEEGTRSHWRAECMSFVGRLLFVRLKGNKRPSARDFERGLFVDMFYPDDVALSNIETAQRLFAKTYRGFVWKGDHTEVLRRLKTFYSDLAQALASGADVELVIGEL